MIKNLQHCIRVQERRVAQRKRGYSKAVRRFLQKHYGNDRKLYQEWLATLPVRWTYTPEQKAALKKKKKADEQWKQQMANIVKHYTGVVI